MSVEGASHGLAAMVARWADLPRPAEKVPVRLTVTANAGGEQWERWFGEKRLVSWQREWRGLLLESFGSWTIGFELVAEGGGMRFIPRRVWWLGLP